MKRNLLLLVLTYFTVNGYAQISSYTFHQSTTTYTPLTGGTVLGTETAGGQLFNNSLTGTYLSATGTGFPIGFDFVFNGATFDKFAVAYDGWIKLGTGTFTIGGNDSRYPMPGASDGHNNMIAAFAKNLTEQAGSEVSYHLLGTAPNRMLVVQWKNVRLYDVNGSAANFQIQLEEGTNKINMIYGSFVLPAEPSTIGAQVGLRGSSATDFNNRSATAAWNITRAGCCNTEVMYISTAVMPINGLMYSWAAAILPMNLVSFTGQVKNDAVVLDWTTVSEENNAGFEVERSADGTHFSVLTTVASKSATGNSNSKLTYSYQDNKPLSSTGYYRLKQVDKDGHFTLSKVITIKPADGAVVSVLNTYPNPVVDQLTLAFYSPVVQQLKLAITDISGRQIRNVTVAATAGDNKHTVNVAELSSGTYLIRLLGGSLKSQVVKFSK